MYFFNMLLTSCLGSSSTTESTTTSSSSGTDWWIIVAYIVVFAAIIYFLMIRPQRKQKKQQESTMNALSPGDSVLTTSGFYGVIVAVNGDTIIVEFGNNKNCRIPMSKQAISQVEKANTGSTPAQSQEAHASNKRKFFGRKNAAADEAAQAEAEAAAAQAEAETQAQEAPAESAEKDDASDK